MVFSKLVSTANAFEAAITARINPIDISPWLVSIVEFSMVSTIGMALAGTKCHASWIIREDRCRTGSSASALVRKIKNGSSDSRR